MAPKHRAEPASGEGVVRHSRTRVGPVSGGAGLLLRSAPGDRADKVGVGFENSCCLDMIP